VNSALSFENLQEPVKIAELPGNVLKGSERQALQVPLDDGRKRLCLAYFLQRRRPLHFNAECEPAKPEEMTYEFDSSNWASPQVHAEWNLALKQGMEQASLLESLLSRNN